MKTLKLVELPPQSRHQWLISAVGPRPIALVSTIDRAGHINLSPFSFFNLFSTNPPVAIFSPSLKGSDRTRKDTHNNLEEVPEVAISVVTYSMVEQVNLTSSEYSRGINEFIKAGLTMSPSKEIQPPFVKESPISFECRVQKIISLGGEGASGNLVICDLLWMHVHEDCLNEQGLPDCTLLDLVGRMGGNWYCRANSSSLFEVPKPGKTPGIGVECLPEHVRNSFILTGNDLGKLGSQQVLPSLNESTLALEETYPDLIVRLPPDKTERMILIHKKMKEQIGQGRTDMALKMAVVFSQAFI